MSKKVFQLLLAAAFVLPLCYSCSDDDSDNLSAEEREQQAQEQASTFWNVVSQLTSAQNYTADYAGKTFEPNIGEPSPSNPYVRQVATNDALSAAQRFAALIGQEDTFDATTTDYEWHDDAVGTLHYRQSVDNTSWATVDVDIKQMPHLQQIVYCAPEQMGTNSSFNGTAYYRFGDVVKIKNAEKADEYWVCVRPAFGPEGKKNSYWVTLSPLPTANQKTIEKNGRTYIVPTELGTSTEQMQNLAELLYAICFHKQWYDNVQNNDAPGIFTKGLRMFHDFRHSMDYLQYHNEYFFLRVHNAWESMGLFKKIFGFESTDANFKKFFEADGGLHLLYSGYSWWSTVSNNLSLYEYTYTSGTDINELNMHKATKKEHKHDMKSMDFNIATEVTLAKPYLSRSDFFGDSQPRYVVRFAKGSDLVAPNAQWDIKQAISGAEDVYVYNRSFYAETYNKFCDLTSNKLEVTPDPDDPKSQIEENFNGHSHYVVGDVIEDADHTHWFCVFNAGGKGLHPYSYFISFQNAKFDPNDKIATNIIEEVTVPKLLAPLATLVYNGIKTPDAAIPNKTIYSIYNWTSVRPEQLFDATDSIVVTSDGKKETRINLTTSIVYQTPEINLQVMRFVMNSCDDPNDQGKIRYDFYTKYPNTNELILLSDIASQEKVSRFAPDRWAVLPNHGSTVARHFRTLPDTRSTDLTNYEWHTHGFATDARSMWNEPVLVMRATKVYERGDLLRGTKTEHGVTIINEYPSEARKIATKEQLEALGSEVLDYINANQIVTMDGAKLKFPDYRVDMTGK